jgi:putative DNA primase/helicase
MSKIDFHQINGHALSALETLVHEWFPQGHKEGHEFKVGSLSGEPGRSMSINLRTGAWKDFASDAGGSDPISLLAAIRSVSMAEAARELGGRLSTGLASSGVSAPPKPDDAPTWTPIVPIPETAPAPTFRHHKFGQHSKEWAYRTSEGGLIGYIVRFDLPDGGKDVVPRCYCKDANGKREWRWLSFAKPRPLYGLDLLAASPKAGVIIVEGEKTADAARQICPGIVVTWPGGGKAVRYADFTPLAGRKVIIWPDRDEPGIAAAQSIAKALAPIAASVRVVTPPLGDPDGWDLADALAEGWDKARVVELLKPKSDPAPVSNDASEPYPHEPPPGWDALPASFIPHDDPEPTPPKPFSRFDDRLQDLPFRILGCDGDAFFYMPDRGHQIVSLSASSHSKPNLMRLAPLQCWEAEYPDRSGADWDCAVNALIQRSQSMPKFDPRRIRGRGCWIDGEDVVFHAGDRLVVNGREAEIPNFRSSVRAIYEGALEIPVDSVEVATNSQAAKVIELCEMLSWERPLYGKLLAGWLALAPVCGALTWRPHLWVTGPSGSGKSWTVANIIQPLVGRTAVHVQGNTSEAGIRGQLGSDALPVVFDEAESEDRASQQRFDKVLELARQASTETGAGIVKGTASGGSVTYLIRSCFLFASIGVAAVKKADTSRVTVLPLRKNTGPGSQAQFDKIKSLWRETLCSDGYAERIRSRSLRYAKIIRINAETFSAVAVEFTGDKRSADQIGTLLAGAFSLTATKEITKEAAREWMAKQDWSGFKSEEVDNDENQCLAHLFAASLKFELQGRNVTRSVSEIVQEILEIPDYTILESDCKRKEELLRTLIRHGMKLSPEGLYVANRHQALEEVFSDTPWAGAKWRLQIERVPGASPVKTMAFGTHIKQRAVLVPVV